jgi:hypothetical protein
LFAGTPDFLLLLRANRKIQIQEEHVRTEPSTSAFNHLEECRIRATRLMKELRASDRVTALRAAKRFQILPAWAGRTLGQIQETRDRIQRKHALAVVAKEAGFEDWLHLKAAGAAGDPPAFDTTRLFLRTATFLNLWFRSYDEARQVLNGEPKRYLFPYREQFVVCESALLESLGVDTNDPDWERIARDWVKPRDPQAHARLTVRLSRTVR